MPFMISTAMLHALSLKSDPSNIYPIETGIGYFKLGMLWLGSGRLEYAAYNENIDLSTELKLAIIISAIQHKSLPLANRYYNEMFSSTDETTKQQAAITYAQMVLAIANSSYREKIPTRGGYYVLSPTIEQARKVLGTSNDQTSWPYVMTRAEIHLAQGETEAAIRSLEELCENNSLLENLEKEIATTQRENEENKSPDDYLEHLKKAYSKLWPKNNLKISTQLLLMKAYIQQLRALSDDEKKKAATYDKLINLYNQLNSSAEIKMYPIFLALELEIKIINTALGKDVSTDQQAQAQSVINANKAPLYNPYLLDYQLDYSTEQRLDGIIKLHEAMTLLKEKELTLKTSAFEQAEKRLKSNKPHSTEKSREQIAYEELVKINQTLNQNLTGLLNGNQEAAEKFVAALDFEKNLGKDHPLVTRDTIYIRNTILFALTGLGLLIMLGNLAINKKFSIFNKIESQKELKNAKKHSESISPAPKSK